MTEKTLAIALSAVLATGLAAQDALAGKGGGGGGGGGHSGGGGMPSMDIGRGMSRGIGSGSAMPGSGGMGRSGNMSGSEGRAYKGQDAAPTTRERHREGDYRSEGEVKRLREGEFAD